MFARVVVAHRRRLGLTQEALAERAGLSVRSLRELEADRILKPRQSSVLLLADAFALRGVEREQFCQQAAGIVPPVPSTAPVPAQLPFAVAGFTGRGGVLGLLHDLLRPAVDTMAGPAVAMALLSGMAGVGKSALAIHWAHRAAPCFPDGQLYLNLRGYDPDHPVTAGEALTRFLVSLGVPSHDIPIDLEDRAGRYRSQLAGRKILLVLDNASSADQVRPLLPGTASCAVLITSRDSLPELIARDGVRRLDLDLLPEADAIALLGKLIGDRADTDPVATAALAARCALLPLALRIAAELATARPTTPLTCLADELDDQRRRLDILDHRAAVITVFSWSIQHLDTATARAFRLMGMHPGESWDPYAVAALAQTSLQLAGRMLETLVCAHLVQRTPDGRYQMHDLLHAYALHLVTTLDSEELRQTAVRRLLDFYLAAATRAMDTLFPSEAHRRPRVDRPAAPMPDLGTAETARTWLDIQRPILLAATALAVRCGRPAYTVQMSRALYRYLDGGHYSDALALHRQARDAAEQLSDHAGRAQAILGIGVIHQRLGQPTVALEHHQQALALFRRADDPAGEARALGNLGMAETQLGRYEAAAQHQREALNRYRRTRDHVGEAYALVHLALIEQRRGHYHSALYQHERPLAMFRDLNDRTGEAYTLNSLGDVEERLGRLAAASDHQELSLRLFDQLGHRFGQALALNSLGILSRRLGQPAPASEFHERALIIFEELGDLSGQAAALNGRGEAAHAAGCLEPAIVHYTRALALATKSGAKDQQVRARTGLNTTTQA